MVVCPLQPRQISRLEVLFAVVPCAVLLLVPVNVSQHSDHDAGPVWNETGSILAWTSRRFGKQNDVLFCYLTRANDKRSRKQWKTWEKMRDAASEPTVGGKDEEKKDDRGDNKKSVKKDTANTNAPIAIDLEDIHLRVRRLTDLPGDERVVAIHLQGDRIVFGADIGGKRDVRS